MPVAVAVAIGRLACFEAGCCYGTPKSLPWGVVFVSVPDAHGVARHPAQLYEAAFNFSAATALFWIGRRGFIRGQLINLYIIGYLAYRFVSEMIRPEPRLWMGLTGYQ